MLNNYFPSERTGVIKDFKNPSYFVEASVDFGSSPTTTSEKSLLHGRVCHEQD